MAKLRLGYVEEQKPVKLSVELPHTLWSDLVRYGEALGQEAGATPIEPGKLIGPMLEAFIAGDRAFSRRRSR